MIDKIEFIKNRFNWIPHKGQKEFLNCSSKIKICACGRRWGKTEMCAYDIAYYFLNYDNIIQMIISPTYNQSKIMFQTLTNILFDIEGIEIKQTPYPTIKLENNIISARTADNNGNNLRGAKAHRIIIDEAAYIQNDVIYEVISPMLADYDGDLIMISTPNGKNHFYEFFKKGQVGDTEITSFQYRSLDNPYISKKYIEKQKESLCERSYQTEYEANFCDNVSNVFSYDKIMESVREIDDFQGEIIMGVDLARYSDWTVVTVLKTDGDRAVLTDIYRFNKMNWKDEIDNIINYVQIHNPVYIIIDATGMGDPISEAIEEMLFEKNLESKIIKFKFTNENKNEIMDKLSFYLDHNKLSILNNEVLIDELCNFQYSLTENGNVKLEAAYGHHDDTVCSLAMAVYGIKYIHTGNVFSF